MPSPARYEIPATRVSRHSLFGLVADEAYRDGQLEPFEQRILREVAYFLELNEAQAAAGRRRSFLRYRARKLGPRRRLDPVYLLEKVFAAMGPGGPADGVEASRVEALRALLEVPQEALPGIQEAAEGHRLRWMRLVREVGLAAEEVEPDAPVSLEQVASGGAVSFSRPAL